MENFNNYTEKQLLKFINDNPENSYDVYLFIKNSGKTFSLDLAKRLIELGEDVSDILDKFEGVKSSKLANDIILHDSEYGAFNVIQNITKFSNLSLELAFTLVEAGYADDVVENLDNFKGVKSSKLAHACINAGEAFSVSQNLDKFSDLDVSVAESLAESGEDIINSLDNFNGLKSTNLVLKIINSESTEDVYDVFHNLDKFSELSFEVYEILTGQNFSREDIVRNIDSFDENAKRRIVGQSAKEEENDEVQMEERFVTTDEQEDDLKDEHFEISDSGSGAKEEVLSNLAVFITVVVIMIFVKGGLSGIILGILLGLIVLGFKGAVDDDTRGKDKEVTWFYYIVAAVLVGSAIFLF